MTDDTMPLLDALLKRGGGDVMKELAEEVLQRLMAYDIEGRIGAGRDERTTQRNGYREPLAHRRTVGRGVVPAAEALEHDHHVAATVLYRALLDDTLARARSPAYGHAARYLAKLGDFDSMDLAAEG